MNSAERSASDRDKERRAGSQPEVPTQSSAQASAQAPAQSPSQSRSDSIPLAQISSSRAPTTGTVRRAEPSRIWVLPSASGPIWAAAESDNPEILRDWASSPPLILSQNLEKRSGDEIAQAARHALTQPATDSFHDAIFRLLSRGLLGGVWILAAVAGLRAPGAFKIVSEVLLVCGVVFLIYAVFRHGSNLLRTQHQLVDAGNAFGKAVWKHSPLLDRFAHAMELRRNTDFAQRGASPDEELLDSGAYRKLIAEGLTTPNELGELGKAVAKVLGLDKPDAALKKNNELAREAKLDVETIMFYKDMISAANEIRLDNIK